MDKLSKMSPIGFDFTHGGHRFRVSAVEGDTESTPEESAALSVTLDGRPFFTLSSALGLSRDEIVALVVRRYRSQRSPD